MKVSCFSGDGFNTAITVLAIIGKGFITIAYSAVYIVTAETYPTRIRNIGMGVSSSFGRLSGMGASFIGGSLVNGTSHFRIHLMCLIHLPIHRWRIFINHWCIMCWCYSYTYTRLTFGDYDSIGWHSWPWWLSGRFGALHSEGRSLESLSSCHVGTLGKSFTRSCL